MGKWYVYLDRDGSIRVKPDFSVVVGEATTDVTLSLWLVEALNPVQAAGKVIAKLYDQTQQPFQHVCTPVPCDRPHLTHCTNPLVCATEGDACDYHQWLRTARIYTQPCGQKIAVSEAEQHLAHCHTCQAADAHHALTGE